MVRMSETSLLHESVRFGDYVTVRLLGRGGMGEVYLMRHAVLGVEHAVKVLYPRFGGKEAEDRRRFLREARSAASVRHPNLVAIYDAGLEEGSGLAYIAMEYLAGGNLAGRIASHGRFAFPEAMEFIRPLAAALKALSAAGITHCDIKPANIMFAADGTLKLTDFGVSRVATQDCDADSATATGTPAYMSPEQLTAPGKVGPRSDIYSLGVVLYEMLSGKLPHSGDTLAAILARAMRLEKIPDLREAVPGVSPSVARLVAEMTAPDMDRRPSSAAEVLALAEDARIESDPVLRRRRTMKRRAVAAGIAAAVLGAVACFTVPKMIAARRIEMERVYWQEAAKCSAAYDWLKRQPEVGELFPNVMNALFLCGFGLGPYCDEYCHAVLDIVTLEENLFKNFYHGEIEKFRHGGRNLLDDYNLIIPIGLPAKDSPQHSAEGEDLLLDWVSKGGTLFLPLLHPQTGSGLLEKAGLFCDVGVNGPDEEIRFHYLQLADAAAEVAPGDERFSLLLLHPLHDDGCSWRPIYMHCYKRAAGAAICFRDWGKGKIIVASGIMVGSGCRLERGSQFREFFNKLLHCSLNPLPRDAFNDPLVRDKSDINVLLASGQLEKLAETGPGSCLLISAGDDARGQFERISPVVMRCADAAARYGLLPKDGDERTVAQPLVVFRPVDSCAYEHREYYFGALTGCYNDFWRGILPFPVNCRWRDESFGEVFADGIIDFVRQNMDPWRRVNSVKDAAFAKDVLMDVILKPLLLDAAGFDDLALESRVELVVADERGWAARSTAQERRCIRSFDRLEKAHPGMTERFFPLYFAFVEERNARISKYTDGDVAMLLSEACGGADVWPVLESEGIARALPYKEVVSQ